jgi:hypothetical protein
MGGESDEPRPGFDRWVSFRGQGAYYDPTINFDGNRRQVKGYVTDILTEEALRFINENRSRPFLLYLGHKAVHGDFFRPSATRGYTDVPSLKLDGGHRRELPGSPRGSAGGTPGMASMACTTTGSVRRLRARLLPDDGPR